MPFLLVPDVRCIRDRTAWGTRWLGQHASMKPLHAVHACCARRSAGHRHLPAGFIRRRSNAQPRWPAMDRPAQGRTGRYRRTSVAGRWRAHCAPGRASCWHGSASRCAARLGRAARDRRTLRRLDPAGRRRANVCDPQASGCGVHTRGLRRRRDHAAAAGRSAAPRRSKAPQRPGGRRHPRPARRRW